MNRLKNLLALVLALALVISAFPTPVAAQQLTPVTEIFFWPADSGPTGTWVGVAGYGFTPDSVITITWNDDPIDTEPEVVVADPGGWFGAMIVVPEVPDGYYTVRATDGEGLWAEALFCVGPPSPGIWLFPADSGPVGTWVGIMGYGFTPDSVIVVTWDGELIATEPEVVVTIYGFFAAMIVVPPVPEGEYIIAATDEEGLWAEALYRVTPPPPPPPPEIWLGRKHGQVGDWVSIDGWYFAPDSVITITWDGELIETDPEVVVTDSPWGWFWTSIVVPDVPDGDYTIKATDGEGRWAEAVFTVGPIIWLWPSYGAVGTWVRIYGEGFTPDSVIAITWNGDPMTTEPEEVATDHWGYFSAIVEVPDVEDGDYIIRATDGEGRWAEAPFSVGPPLPPELWVSPWQGPAGRWIGIYGSGFAPESVIAITWDDEPIETEPESVVTDRWGDFWARIVVPEVPDGDCIIRATDGEGRWAEVLFTVGPPLPPDLSLWPQDGPAGTWVPVWGWNFTPDSVITITWDGEPMDTAPEVVMTDPWGNFWAEIVVPNVPEGDYTIRATDGEGLWAEALFWVGPPAAPPPVIWPWIGLWPDKGPAGSWVTIHGWGFAPDSVITITWDSEPIDTEPEVVVTGPWGRVSGWFWAEIAVPDVPDGDYTIRATDGEGRWAEAVFTVGPTIWLVPSYGAAGTWVRIGGDGFTPDSVITITWDGAPIATEPEEVVTDPSWGWFEAIIVVPDVRDGDYTIRATDGEGRWAEAVFAVGPPVMWVWPLDGLVGTLVYMSGYGFTPDSVITITWDGQPIQTEPEEVMTDEWWGYFWAEIVVPDVPDGYYTIRVTDERGLSAEVLFWVGFPPPGMGLWPSDGLVGTVVSIWGWNFAPDSVITITWDGEPIQTDPEEVMTEWWGWLAEIVVPHVPPGDYTIRATDGEGRWAEATFTVIALPLTPRQAIENLIYDIEALELKRGTENSLVRKLEAAISSLDRGQTNAAANQLAAFINEVNALKGKKLPDAEASPLIERIQAIIDSL